MQLPPYPATTKAGGFKFELDCERIAQSDTWALATARQRPLLLMLWFVAWQQTPCGSLPADDVLIAARLGMEADAFQNDRAILLRGWWEASDGRLYHPVLTELVLEMMGRKAGNAQRQAAYRQRRQGVSLDGKTDDGRETNEAVTRYSGVSDNTTTTTITTNTSLSDERDSTNTRTSSDGKSKATLGVADLIAEGVDRQHAEDWLVVRKAKRAPLTRAAWDDVKAEAKKAGVTPAEAVRIAATRSWQGFKASWLISTGGANAPAPGALKTNGTHTNITHRGDGHGRNYGTGGPL